METEPVSMPLSQKLRVPADIVFITLPLLCWALIIFRSSGLWLTEPWMVGVTVFYYALAAAYLVFTVMVRMRVVEIVGLFLLLFACIFMWLPYHWVLAVLLVPALSVAFFKRGSRIAVIVLTTLIGIVMAIMLLYSWFSSRLEPEKYAYHVSPNGQYVALEHKTHAIFNYGTYVLLYRAYGPLLVQTRELCIADTTAFGGSIEWLDERTIMIYGEKTDVLFGPTIRTFFPVY